MKYTRARFIDNGKEEPISIFSINDDNREFYKDKLYCPQPGCTAKLHEYKRNGRVYYQANPNSHIEDCEYKNDVTGSVPVGNGEIEIPLSERHFQQSIRDSYNNSVKPKDQSANTTDGNNVGTKTTSTSKSGNADEGKAKGKGVIDGEKVPGVKEPPILNREMFTDADIGYPRKITGIKIKSAEEVDGTLKIMFNGKNYSNMYAIIGEPYKAENGVSDEQVHLVKKYIDYNISNDKDIRFWGGGIINKYSNSDLYVMELFFQESFIINGYEILGICSWVRHNLS